MTYQRLPVKRLGAVFLGKMIQPEPKSARDVQAPYLRAAHVQPHGRIIDVDDKTMWFDPQELRLHDLREGDVVIVEGGAGYGRSAVVGNEHGGWGFQNSIIRVRPHPGRSDGRFVDYALQSAMAAGEVTVACFVSTIPHFTADKVGAFPIPAPPIAEQCAIADYLDHETAQIDALIGKQGRLIDTLRERRAAVVERAVSEGLDASVEFGANDHEWLPPLSPAHWTLTQLGFRTRTLAGYAFPSEGFRSDDALTRLLRGINIKPGRLDWAETVYWDERVDGVPEAFRLVEGDLVLGMDRPFVSGGVRIASVSQDDLPALLLQRVMLLRCDDSGDQQYLARLVSTKAFLSYLEPLFTGVSVPHMSEWQVRKFRAPFPPLAEQRRIVAYLDEQTAKIDALIAKAERFIEVSKERRSALVTAAVTGQIDVRERVDVSAAQGTA